MIRRIEETCRTSWVRAIGNTLRFSEYMTYGMFVDDVVGAAAAGHAHTDAPTLHLSWDYDLSDDAGMSRFFADIRPEHFGVMIHSKDGISPDRYRARVEQLWAAGCA